MKKLSSLFIFSSLIFVSSAMADVIFTDGLTTSAGTVYNTTTAGNFTAWLGNVDVLQAATGPYGYLCGSAATCIDLNGNTLGGIVGTNSFSLNAGEYELTFTLGDAQRGVTANTTVQVNNLAPNAIGPLFLNTYSDPQSLLPITVDFFVATGTTANLAFTSGVDGAAGDILSGVTLSAIAPEPSTIFLALPLIALGVIARRRSTVTA